MPSLHPILVSVEKLRHWFDPLGDLVWPGTDAPLSVEEVEEAITVRQFESTPFAGLNSMEESWTRGDHAARIAYLVVHGWEEPIVLDVGVPGLGSYASDPVLDGHHRLAAAIVRGDPYIHASVSGSEKVIEWLMELPQSPEDLSLWW